MAAEAVAYIASLFSETAVVTSTSGSVASVGGVSAGAINAAAAIGATAYGAAAQNKAADAQKRSIREQQRIADLKNQREVREQVRQERIKRASILQSGENVGASESSGVLGGAGSVTSQAAGNISFLDNLASANQASNLFGEKAASYVESASTARGVASIFSSRSGPNGARQIGKTIFDVTK